MTVFVSAQAGVNLHAAWENVGRVRRGADVEAEDRAAAEPGRLPAVQPAILDRQPDRIAVPGYPESFDAFEQMFVRDKQELRGLGIPLEVGTTLDDEVGYRIARQAYVLPDITLSQTRRRCWRWRPECGSGPSWRARSRVRC